MFLTSDSNYLCEHQKWRWNVSSVNLVCMNLRLQRVTSCPISLPAHHIEKFAQAADAATTAPVHHWRNGCPAVCPRAVTLTLTVDREQRTSTCNESWQLCYVTPFTHYLNIHVYYKIPVDTKLCWPIICSGSFSHTPEVRTGSTLVLLTVQPAGQYECHGCRRRRTLVFRRSVSRT
jgi:hypothetical protein